MMRTFSPTAILRTISPYTQGMGANLPGQSVCIGGQPSQVASCGSHSAGMGYPSAAGMALIADSRDRCRGSAGDRPVGVDPAVPQEGPIAPDFLDASQVDLAKDDLLSVHGGLGQDHALRVAQKRAAPELDSGTALGRHLMTHPVDRGDVHAVGDGVAPLDGPPGIVLGGAVGLPSREDASR